MNQHQGLHRIDTRKQTMEFTPITFYRIYSMRRSKGFTVRNAFKDAWRTVRGIY